MTEIYLHFRCAHYRLYLSPHLRPDFRFRLTTSAVLYCLPREALVFRSETDLLPEAERTLREQRERAFQQGTSREAEIARVLRAFNKVDTDHDDGLNQEEFMAMLQTKPVR